MKILLLGKNGQVGEALQSALAPLGQLVAWGREDACFEHPNRLAESVASQGADVIVNAAAYTAVDKAEREPATAFLVNAEAVSVLAALAKRQGTWLVHYSTDYVFDGHKVDAYTEDDPTNRLSVYGRSKLAGDKAIVASGCLYLIFRVSWIYAAGHANFPRALLRLARDKSGLDVVADQIGAPTSAELIATITAGAIARVARDRDAASLSGVYNLAAAGKTSRADMVRLIVDEASAMGLLPLPNSSAIRSVTSDAFPMPAARPLNSQLATTKLCRTFAVDLPPWQDGMRAWVARELVGEHP